VLAADGLQVITLREKLLGLFLLVGLTLCSWASRDLDYDRQQQISSLLQAIPLLREALLQEVLRINSTLSWTPESLDDAAKEVDRSIADLDALFRQSSWRDQPEIRQALLGLKNESAEDARALKKYKAERMALRKSIEFLPLAYAHALESSTGEDRRLLKDVMLETMLYHHYLATNYRLPIEADLRGLSQPNAPAVKVFVANIRDLLQLDPRQTLELRELSKLTDRSKPLTSLAGAYHGILRSRAQRRTALVALQYLMSLVLLVFLARTLRKQNKTFSQLQELNSVLEQRVCERTRSLEASHAEREQILGDLARSQRLESLGQLAAGIAHEMNTPIQFVGDNTRFLRESFQEIEEVLQRQPQVPDELAYLQTEVPLAIEQSLEGLNRVAELVRSLKAYSHPGGESKTPADLNELVRTTATLARNEWRYVAELHLQLDETLPRTPCYPSELNQVLLNLLVNAAHAIQDKIGDEPSTKGEIAIQTRTRESFVEISIQDSGVGMTEETRRKMFDPFFTTKEIGRGTGQGLSIAYDLVVNKLDGRLMCDSEPGRGTCFTISIPLAA
jgi:signal transduction histidine kinase